mmetsp:Transcript_16996/g.36616  ORF Transcript_16996/g.36616 Transcript_16996/m.36616 type:complete len:515 (+) Transcript_16996:212-1756(+)
MSDDEPLRVTNEIIRIAKGRTEVPFGEIAKDDLIQQTFEAVLGTLKAARKRGLIQFEGELLLLGKHDKVPIKVTEKGFSAKDSPADNEEAVKGKKITFFEGDEALKEVAKPDGAWNWVLLGPDPDKLPLAGGGGGSIEQMKEAMGSHANTFGLLRLAFGNKGAEKVKWIYVHASNVDDKETGGFSMRERGQAMAKGPLMEKTIDKYVRVNAKVEITTKDNCNPEWIIDKLAKVNGADARFLTVDKYNQGMEDFRKANPEPLDEEASAVRDLQALEPEMGANDEPLPEEVVARSAAEQAEEEQVKQRKKTASVRKGDPVKVWGESTKKWHDDGIVLEIAREAFKDKDGVTTIPAGSIKVQYLKNKRFKWVPPNKATTKLQKSKRPCPPSPLYGELWKETHGTFTSWHVRYFELQLGFLSWWEDKDAAKNNSNKHGSFPMLGLQMKIEGTIMKVTTTGCKGIIYSFDAASKECLDLWVAGFNKHAKYADDMRAHVEAQKEKDRQDAEAEGAEGGAA